MSFYMHPPVFYQPATPIVVQPQRVVYHTTVPTTIVQNPVCAIPYPTYTATAAAVAYPAVTVGVGVGVGTVIVAPR